MESKLVIFVAFATLLQTALVSAITALGVVPVSISVPIANAETEALTKALYTDAIGGYFKALFTYSGSLADLTTVVTTDQIDFYNSQSLDDYQRAVEISKNSVIATDGSLSDAGAAAGTELLTILTEAHEAFISAIALTIYQGDPYTYVTGAIEKKRSAILALVPDYAAANIALISNGNSFDDDVSSALAEKQTEYAAAVTDLVNAVFDAIQQLLKNLFVDRSITSGDFGNLQDWQSAANTAIATKCGLISDVRVIVSDATAASK